MKSERRHELQQNDLAIYLDRINKAIEPYSRIIAFAVGALIIGSIALMFYNTQQSGQRSDATLQLIQASASQDAEQLLTVSDNYPETEAGAWARLYQGRQYLIQGIQRLYSDRTDAQELLEDARAAFNNAIATSDDPLLRSRAHFGIARAAESLGNIDEAIDAYRDVIAVNESEAMVKKAEDRIETLANPETKEFLAWFADQDFSPADPSLPPSLPGGDALPDMPDFSLPGIPGLELGGDDKMDLKDGGIEMPEEGAAKEPGDDAAKEVDAAKEDDAAKADPATAPEQPAENAKQPASETTQEAAKDEATETEPVTDDAASDTSQ